MASKPAEPIIKASLTPMTQKLRVVRTNPVTDPRWETFVNEHPNGSIYHHPAWLQALQQEYGQEGVFLICEDAHGHIRAILPLLYTKGLPFGLGTHLTGRRLSSLPRTPLAGPLSVDERATAALLQAAVQLISQQGGVQLQIKTLGCTLDGIVEGVVCTPWRLSYLLKLPASSDGPFRIRNSHTRASVKWAINKATRLGVQARPAETETELRAWYSLYLETMRQNFVPPRPYRFFAALWNCLKPKGMMRLLLAEQHATGQSRIIAGSIFLTFGNTVSYAFNGSCLSDLPLRPNDVIQWQAINDACASGAQLFDFGEVPDGNEDLAKFKSKWGAEPVRLYRYYFPCSRAGSTVGGGDLPTYSALARAVWRRLPLGTISWLGDRIYARL
jgi:CelD/BcsL family acetyltransferase involved in cellulose biosynthesis